MIENIVVVTGASSGIGRELAKQFHFHGYKVILVARREDRLKELVADMNTKRFDSAEYRVCDLSDRAQSKALAEELANKEIYGLVNNAGVGSVGYFYKLDLNRELSQVELNIVSPLVLSHAVIPKMVERKEGFIINVSSIMAYQTVPFVGTYCGTKSFEWQHSVALSRELEHLGIKVMTLCPGPTETEFFGVAKAPTKLKLFKRVSGESVAKACVKDLMLGKKICIPNWQARFLILLAQIMPTSVYTWICKKIIFPAVG